jgi:catechol 2,3-dioxygenase-like lactoylglutathione lyase family enzyme
LGRSHAFYSGVLGLTRVEDSSMANVYDAHGTPLRVTLVHDHVPSRFTVLGWYVNDLVQSMAELKERGIQFRSYEGYDQDDDGVWTAPNGRRVAWFEDPDGNIISLSEPPRS